MSYLIGVFVLPWEGGHVYVLEFGMLRLGFFHHSYEEPVATFACERSECFSQAVC